MSRRKGPTPGEVRKARADAGLSVADAAALVRSLGRSWRHWESGHCAMHPGLWELFRIKTGQQASA